MNRILLLLSVFLTGVMCSLQANHLSSHLQLTARLTGAQEVPAVTTDAQGLGIFTLDEKKSTLYINISLSHLSSDITGMHIHEGPVGENGGVIFDLGDFLTGNRAKGALYNLTLEEVSKFLSGAYYINVHTSMHLAGEIRGQIGLETDYRYTAQLSGAQEVPEVATAGIGLGIFHLNHAQTSVKFKIIFRDLSGPVMSAHIHSASAGVNGPVIFDLGPFLNGNTFEGVWEPGFDLDDLLSEGLYVNIHTADHPGGEIRGQIILMPGLTFDLDLSGDQENPPVVTDGKGLGIVTILPDLSELEYYILFDGTSGPVSAAHFHRAPAGVNGGVVIDLSSAIQDNVISGSTALTPDYFNTLLNGGFYINLHTAAHPGGEIRGQVYRFAREGYTFDLNGGQEVPPVVTSGVGAGMVSIDRDQTNAHYMIVVSNLTGDFGASHFHNAGPGINGSVIFDIGSSFNTFGGAEGYWDENSNPVFNASPLFIAHEVYVNVHTSTSPGGEIRGNVIRSSRLYTSTPVDPGFTDHLLLSAVLTGDDEVPPVTTDAVALATVYFDMDKNKASVNITAKGLSGPITGVHIHEGESGTNGPIMFPLTNEGNRVQMEIDDIDQFELISLMNNATYVNIHTDAHPGGEIRGQLMLEQDLTFLASLDGDQENPSVTTNARGLGTVHYTLGQLFIDINLQLSGLESDITGVHIHSGDVGVNGPILVDLDDLREGNIVRGRKTITITDLIAFLLGGAYFNVHTVDNPNGEIRGQLNYLPGITFDGWMSALQEVPFATSEAHGLAVGTIFPGLSDITLWMLVDGISGPINAAHLHRAFVSQNGGVVHDLSGDIAGNTILHLGSLENGVLSSLLQGEIYINAHTAAFPGGEVRGQLFRRARDGYGFDLCPEQEVDIVDAPGATGSGMVSFDRELTNSNIFVVTDGLTGPLAASHIHQADIGVNGNIITDLSPFYNDGTLFLYGVATDREIIDAVRSGSTYINVHTALYPAGEIRGQIVKEFLCSIETGIDPLSDILTDVLLSPVPVLDFLQVTLDAQISTKLSFHMVDISGKTLSSSMAEVVQGTNSLTLPTANLLPGFYVLMITDGHAAQAYKFVK